MRDRQVLSPDMLDGVQFAALAAAWLDAQSANPGNDACRLLAQMRFELGPREGPVK
jgi:hypothetical protein